MNFRKFVILSVLFLSVFFISNSMIEQAGSDIKQMDILIKESFDSLFNYKFLGQKHQALALKIGKTLIDLIDTDINNNHLLENILNIKYWVESKLAIWQAVAFVDDEFKSLSYRKLQEIKLEILDQLITSSVLNEADFLNKKKSNKLMKSFNINKKLYSKYKKLFEVKLFLYSDFIKNYFSFIDNFLKNGSSFNLSLDEERLDNLIAELSLKKQDAELNDINSVVGSFDKKQTKVVSQIIELFIQNLLKIKVEYLYNKGMATDFDQAFASKNSSNKMLIIKHYILLTKGKFKNFLQDNETSSLFNRYLDLVIFYLNNPNALEQPLFIYNFFQLYSDLDDLKEDNKGILPFVSFAGNGELLNVISDLQEILNIILKNVNDKMGVSPGWLSKFLLGKTKISPKVMNLAIQLLEDKVLSKI